MYKCLLICTRRGIRTYACMCACMLVVGLCVSGMSRLGSDDFVNILTSDFNWQHHPTVAQAPAAIHRLAPWEVKPAGNQLASYQTDRSRYEKRSLMAANNKLRPQFLPAKPPPSGELLAHHFISALYRHKHLGYMWVCVCVCCCWFREMQFISFLILLFGLLFILPQNMHNLAFDIWWHFSLAIPISLSLFAY